MKKHVLTRSEQSEGCIDRVHPLNAERKRRAHSLGDATGLTKIGIHYVEIEPGGVSTVQHSHVIGDEFMVLISGQGELLLDRESIPVGPGDFVGLPAGGPAHALKNTGNGKLVYLVGGDRPAFDVCHYPELKKRAYLYLDGKARHLDFVEDEWIEAK